MTACVCIIMYPSRKGHESIVKDLQLPDLKGTVGHYQKTKK